MDRAFKKELEKSRAFRAKLLLISPKLLYLSVVEEGNAPFERELRGFERRAGVW